MVRSSDNPATGVSRGALRGRRPIDLTMCRTRPSSVSWKPGSSGKKFRLKSNYFQLESQPSWDSYMYHVAFNQDEDCTFLKKALLRSANSQNILRGHIFDGANLFAAFKLPQDVTVLNVV